MSVTIDFPATFSQGDYFFLESPIDSILSLVREQHNSHPFPAFSFTTPFPQIPLHAFFLHFLPPSLTSFLCLSNLNKTTFIFLAQDMLSSKGGCKQHTGGINGFLTLEFMAEDDGECWRNNKSIPLVEGKENGDEDGKVLVRWWKPMSFGLAFTLDAMENCQWSLNHNTCFRVIWKHKHELNYRLIWTHKHLQ